MNYTNRLYHILHPNQALIASQLNYEQFARHYQLRSMPQATGKLIFSEIDINFRNKYFDIDKALTNLSPHEDGSPKRTKFISCYRITEHIDLTCIRKLYLTNPDGSVLNLEPAEYDNKVIEEESLKIYAEICPLSMLVLTKYALENFSKIMTDPGYGKGAPKIFFTALDFNVQEFIENFEKNPFMPAPITSLHPSKLKEAVLELQSKKDKKMKGLCLTSSLDNISYKSIQRGFWFVSARKKTFFPMPALKEIEKQNYKFWKSM